MLSVATAALAASAMVVAWGRSRAGPRLARLRANGSGAANRISIAVAAAAVGVLAAASDPSPVVLVSGIAGAALAARSLRSARRRSAAAARRAAVVEVTFALAAELRAGRTPAEALGAVATGSGPLRDDLLAASNAAARGGDASRELGRSQALEGAEAMRYLAAAWSVAETVGGRVAGVLDRLGTALEADDELRRELDAALAGPRATMLLLAALPAFGLVLGDAVGAQPLGFLLHRPLGWGLLGAAVLLDAAGVAAMSAIARLALRA
ncbi:MAG TPA: type II secretion system F family protein [Mycobacteriales bacterium]|nr:type II secretion system F family protein [Mycobacteriales bacterium]